jgi:hypothetical protein
VEKVGDGVYKVCVRISSQEAEKLITLTLKLQETLEQSQLVFKPLLIRFMGGEDYQNRPVRISDSGRIRNEIQTLCSEALEYEGDEGIRIHFPKIPMEVISKKNQQRLLDILKWYKMHHPIWFAWLELVE